MTRLPARSTNKNATFARFHALGVLLLIGFSIATGHASAQTPFYQASAADIAGPPGTLIRSEPMLFAPAGAQAFRVLYRSTGLHGEPIAVSGVVVIPPGPPPPGGRPIVAWAHPTTGVVPHCAPSLAIFVFQQMMGLRPMVERGVVVVADGLSWPRHGRSASLSGRRQRRPRRAGIRARRASDAGRRRRQPFRGMGTFAGRPGRALHWPACHELCA